MEDPYLLFRRGSRVFQIARHRLQIETSTEQLAQELSNMADEGADNFLAILDRVVFEEHPILPAEAFVRPLTSEKLLIRDELACKPVRMEEALMRMAIDSNANSRGTDDDLSALLELCALRTFDKVLRTPAALKTITDALLNSTVLIACCLPL